MLTEDFKGYNQIRRSPVNDNRENKVLIFVNKNQPNILNDGGHRSASGISKTAIDLTIASPSLQPILHWSVTDSPLSSDYYMKTVNIQSKDSEPQTIITKININKANLHLLTWNEAWKEVTNPNWSQSAEALTKDFYKKKIKKSTKSAIPVIQKKHFPKTWGSSQLQKLKDKRERYYKIYRKTNREQHLIRWKKSRAEFKSLAKKNMKKDWESFASSVNSNVTLNQAWNRVSQLKSKY